MGLTSEETELPDSEKLQEVADKAAELEQEEKNIIDGIKNAWLNEQPISDEYDTIKLMVSEFKLDFSDTKKKLEEFPKEYIIGDKDIPSVVKSLRKYRRTLKGEEKIKLTDGIETLIKAYSLHLDDCIKSIYWLSKYEAPLRKMNYTEQDLKKIHSIKDANRRSQLVDILCKYWEAELDIKDIPYSENYSKLSKEMSNSKKEYRTFMKKISHQSIRKNVSDQLNDFIIERVCSTPGISARELHDNMPSKLYKRSSPQIISKSINKLGITNINGCYYKLNDDIKKDLYAYTASFIDSDGYITIDKNYNPRVGLVATGDRGKAFMIQIQKELGIGKLHLDQKSPQNTRPVNRLNFYSQADVHELLTKCMPHFRMKGKNAELLLELIKMKRGHKKADWYKTRCEEIFKLMKYENHKDHVGYDFTKYGIDFETVAKLHDNCKMDIMNELENISTPILKSDITFSIYEVTYETDGKDVDIITNFVITLDEVVNLDKDELDDEEVVEERLANWLSEETGWLIKAFSYDINKGE